MSFWLDEDLLVLVLLVLAGAQCGYFGTVLRGMDNRIWEGGQGCGQVSLEALAVDNGRPCLVVLLLAYPHLLEGGE